MIGFWWELRDSRFVYYIVNDNIFFVIKHRRHHQRGYSGKTILNVTVSGLDLS